jgi:hypothetical protein
MAKGTLKNVAGIVKGLLHALPEPDNSSAGDN